MNAQRDDAWMTADEAAAYLRLRFRRGELDAELGRYRSRLSEPAATFQP